ncbi:MAG TPA: hypothetical protein VGI97_08655 [Gemmatimonadaceae bacterium]
MTRLDGGQGRFGRFRGWLLLGVLVMGLAGPVAAQHGIVLAPQPPAPQGPPPTVKMPMSPLKRGLIGAVVGFAIGSVMWRLPWATESCLSSSHWRCAGGNGAAGAAAGFTVGFAPRHEKAPKPVSR